MPITAEEHARWLTPYEAITLLKSRMNEEEAVHTILRRLRSEKIISAAESAYDSHIIWSGIPTRFPIIKAELWKRMSNSEKSFWISGDITLPESAKSLTSSHDIYYIDVRFDPDGIGRIIPKTDWSKITGIHQETNSVSREAVIAADPPKRNLKPISAAHLDAFMEFYLKIKGHAGTEADALEFARHVFPDRHISRAMVRQRRHPSPVGRRPKPED